MELVFMLLAAFIFLYIPFQLVRRTGLFRGITTGLWSGFFTRLFQGTLRTQSGSGWLEPLLSLLALFIGLMVLFALLG